MYLRTKIIYVGAFPVPLTKFFARNNLQLLQRKASSTLTWFPSKPIIHTHIMSRLVSNFKSVAPATTNNLDEDVDRIIESPLASPDANKYSFEHQSSLKRADTSSSSFEEPRPLRRTDTMNCPPPPTQINEPPTPGVTRSNTSASTLPKYGRHSSQWLFKGFSVRRDIFRMKLDDDHPVYR
ncbi:hypothetical protein BDD12DRAFT_307677 [Trichophaea hybrida]|nr:hypothetical protein BDD12DRAFT_307677 [Trichophaea hybrida]